MRDLHHNLLPEASLKPQAVTTVLKKGDAIDLQFYEGAMLVWDLGEVGNADNTATLKWQESDTTTDGDFTDIDDANLLGGANSVSFTAAIKNTCVSRSYIGTKRYVRAYSSVVAGTTPSLMLSGIVVKGHGRRLPSQA